MAIAYTKKNDIRLNSSFTITNTEASSNITVSVATPPGQVTKITLYTDYVLTPGQSLEIKPTVVCRYLVTVKKGGETALEYFTYIDDITEYFIKDSLEFLCGDGCEDCKEKTNKDCKQEKCDPHYSLFNQVIFLYKWYHSTTTTIDILNIITSLYYTEMLDNLCTETFKSKILGEDCCINTFLFKKMIIFAYYDFYHSITEYITNEVTIINKQAEYDKLDAKFQILKFGNCIKNYGLTISQLESYY